MQRILRPSVLYLVSLAFILIISLPTELRALASQTTLTTNYGTNTDVSFSTDGSTVALITDAALEAGDTNGKNDVYVYEVDTDTYERVSVDSSENESTDGNSSYDHIDMSSDGNYVVFTSNVSDLVAGDTNGFFDIFIRDRSGGLTERLSVDSAESELDASAYNPSVSDDGQFVVFDSIATDAVAGDTNGNRDVFIRDRVATTTERISVNSSEQQLTGGSSQIRNKSISADGRYVVFTSFASDAVAGDTNGDGDVFLRDRTTTNTTRVSLDESSNQLAQSSNAGTLTSNGKYVLFRTQSAVTSEDTNSLMDVYLKDLSTNIVTLVSKNEDNIVGNQHSQLTIDNMQVDENGRYVLFVSNASNFIDGYSPPFGPYTLYLKDLTSGKVEMINDDYNQQSFYLAGDSKSLVFIDGAYNLILAQPDSVFPTIPTNIALQGGGTTTEDTTPTFTGDCELGDIVTLYIDSSNTGISSVCNSFSITSTELTPGEYNISFTATRMGTESSPSEVLAITIAGDNSIAADSEELAETGVPIVYNILFASTIVISVTRLWKSQKKPRGAPYKELE